MNGHEIESAIQGVFDGILGDDDCLELREVLKTDHAARALYFQQASLHQMLTYSFARSHPVAAIPLTRPRPKTRRGVRMAMAAAAVLALALTLKLLYFRAPAALATLVPDAGARFNVKRQVSDDKVLPTNELRNGDRVRLEQGALEIRTRHGARAVVLSPADFRIVSENLMRLDEGTAWFEIGGKASGFQVTTPAMTVTDLGTRFGVVARPEAGHEVHVFSGRVIARDQTTQHGEESLTTGMARLCETGGGLKAADFRPEAFLSQLPAHSDTGLIVNGDFESGNPPPARTYGPPANAALLPGWLFGSNIIVMSATSEGRPGYGEGKITIHSSTHDIQLGFNSDTAGRPDPESVTLRQTFATSPGRSYAVRFEMGAIIFNPATMEVTAAVHDGSPPGLPSPDTALARHIESRPPEIGNGYNSPATFNFTALSDTTTLIFTETSAKSRSADPVIDNVSVRQID